MMPPSHTPKVTRLTHGSFCRNGQKAWICERGTAGLKVRLGSRVDGKCHVLEPHGRRWRRDRRRCGIRRKMVGHRRLSLGSQRCCVHGRPFVNPRPRRRMGACVVWLQKISSRGSAAASRNVAVSGDSPLFSCSLTPLQVHETVHSALRPNRAEQRDTRPSFLRCRRRSLVLLGNHPLFSHEQWNYQQ